MSLTSAYYFELHLCSFVIKTLKKTLKTQKRDDNKKNEKRFDIYETNKTKRKYLGKPNLEQVGQ